MKPKGFINDYEGAADKRRFDSEVMKRWRRSPYADTMRFEIRKKAAYDYEGAADKRRFESEVMSPYADTMRFEIRKKAAYDYEDAADKRLEIRKKAAYDYEGAADKRRFDSEVKKRWRRSLYADTVRFDIRKKARPGLRDGESGNLVRLGEREGEVRERRYSGEKNHREKTRFETRQRDDVRRRNKRDSERAAELIKLQKMENTAEIEANHESFRELEYLSGCSLCFVVHESHVVTGVSQGSRFWNPLAEFGLKLKDECYLDDDDDEDDGDGDLIVEEKCENSPEDSMASDDKALRAAMLKSRYAEIILKAQQKKLFN